MNVMTRRLTALYTAIAPKKLPKVAEIVADVPVSSDNDKGENVASVATKGERVERHMEIICDYHGVTGREFEWCIKRVKLFEQNESVAKHKRCFRCPDVLAFEQGKLTSTNAKRLQLVNVVG